MSKQVIEYLIESGVQEIARYLVKKERISEKEALALVYRSEFYRRLANPKSGLYGESEPALVRFWQNSSKPRKEP